MDEREKIISIIRPIIKDRFLLYCHEAKDCINCDTDCKVNLAAKDFADTLIAARIRDITREGYICMNGEVIVPTPNIYNKVADLLACPRIKECEIEGDVRGMIPDKIHLEFTEAQYNQLMNALCYARLYLKALIMYEEKEFGDTDKLNALIYEDTLKLFRDIQDQRLKELGW